jgi:hypothetical protein
MTKAQQDSSVEIPAITIGAGNADLIATVWQEG